MLLQKLKIDFRKVAAGDREEMKRYSYCVAAGSAMSKGMEFNFTIDDYIKACPPDWRQKTKALIDEGKKKSDPIQAATSEEKKEAEEDQTNEENETAAQSKKKVRNAIKTNK